MRRITFFLLLCLAIRVFAQEQRLSIAAEASTIQEYLGQAGDTIRVSASAIDAGEDTPDLVLWIVYDGRVLAYNDNGSEAPSISLTLPEDGFYQIYLDSFNGVSVGEANFSIELINRFNTVTDENSIVVDLPASAVFRHRFEASGDTSIRVSDLTGALDPYIQLFDEAGELVGENDDHASSDFTLGLFDSFLSLNLPEASYTLEIRDFLGKAGQLEISFN